MNTELKPNAAAEKIKYWNKVDEAYGFLCLSISKDLLFHISGLKTPKEIWDHLATLFDKHDDIQIYQLENKLISLNPSRFESVNEFFTKFKHLVLQLKQCKVEKDDDQLILAILSKHGLDYLVFISTFHTGNLTIPNWKIPSLDAFIKTLTNKHDKLIQMGILRSSKDNYFFSLGPKDSKGKGKQNNPKEKV